MTPKRSAPLKVPLFLVLRPLIAILGYYYTIEAHQKTSLRCSWSDRDENHNKIFFPIFNQEEIFFLSRNHFLECSPT